MPVITSQLRGMGSVVSSPSEVRGKALAENRFRCILSLKKKSGDTDTDTDSFIRNRKAKVNTI